MDEKYMTIRKAKIHPWIEKRNLIIAILVLAIMMSGMFYYFVYPRTSVEIETWYQEGWMGSVTLDVTIRNNAASTLEGMKLTIIMENSTGDEVATHTYERAQVGAWNDVSFPSLTITGMEMGNNTHFDDYNIILNVSFGKSGSSQEHSFIHNTEEPYLNLIYRDEIGGFLF